MASEHIQFTQRGGVATLTINRPEKDNAVNAAMMTAMIEAIREATADGANVLVLTGEGDSFCGGREQGKPLPANAAEWSQVLGQIVETNQALAGFPGISIAAAKGRVQGFGCGIAVLSDITIAADSARFGFPEIKAGFPPTVVMSYLSRWTARKKAFEWVISGEEISAQEAERYGLVNKIVAADQVDGEVARWISLLSQRNHQALRACKEFFRETAELDPADAYKYGVAYLANYNASRS